LKPISYIIGDIHGQADLLEKLRENIVGYHDWKFPQQPGQVIYLGDYIDRGPKSLEVIDMAMSGISNFESIFLKGNHEQFVLEACYSYDRSTWHNWMSAGGEITLKSLGYDLFEHGYDAEILRDYLGPSRLKWLKNLKLSYRLNDIVCVHAGLVPDVPLADQVEKDMLWIRNRFLKSDFDFGFGVVHGHTPEKRPIVKQNRICIDTGAGMGGELTALVVDKPWPELRLDPKFLSV